MKNKIAELKFKVLTAEGSAEIEAVEKEMEILANKNPKKFNEDTFLPIRVIIKRVRNRANSVLEQLNDITTDISWGKITKHYFGDKSVSWLYDRLYGIDDKANEVKFTFEEKRQLKYALYDLSERIKKSADNI
jgi:hypothetical protein